MHSLWILRGPVSLLQSINIFDSFQTLVCTPFLNLLYKHHALYGMLYKAN